MSPLGKNVPGRGSNSAKTQRRVRVCEGTDGMARVWYLWQVAGHSASVSPSVQAWQHPAVFDLDLKTG